VAQDRQGKPIAVGTKIHVTGVVKSIHHDSDIAAIEIEFDEPGVAGGKASIICNSNQVEEFDGNTPPPVPPPGSKG
jgi:uncharacterized protein (DUF433 family)